MRFRFWLEVGFSICIAPRLSAIRICRVYSAEIYCLIEQPKPSQCMHDSINM